MVFRKIIVLVMVLFLTGWNPKKTIYECQNKISTGSKNLKNVENKIKKKSNETKKYESRKKEIGKEIEALNVKRKKLGRSMRSVDSKISKNKKKEAGLVEEIRISSMKLKGLKNYLNEDVERYYLDAYALSGRYEPFNVGVSYLLSEIDRKISVIGDVRSRKQETENKRKKLVVLRDDLNSLKKKREKEKKEYARLESKKKALQRNLDTKKRAAENEIAELRRSALVLATLIEKFKEEKVQAQKTLFESELARKKIASLKGKLSWPVEGKVVSRFGKQHHPDVDTYIYNNGIEIESTARKSVHSVARGKVVFAGDFTGYGRMVILDHQGGYFSIYANLGEILVKEKQRVKAFEAIGRLDAFSDKVTLYFEFRKRGEAVNPMVWLRK